MAFTDYLNSLRYDQMFGQQQPMQEQAPIGIDQMGMMPQGMPQMPQQAPSQPFQPEHQASDFLTSILSQLPEHHKASLMDRIFAGITGLAGPAGAPTQDRILDGDYNQQMQDWNMKAAAATNAANMEKSNNTLAKSAYDTNESRKITQQRADEYVRRGTVEADKEKSLAADKEAKQKIAEQKMEILKINAANPGAYSWKTGADGYIYGLNTKTGESTKTDVKSGDLSLLDKHNLRMQEIAAQGANAIATKEATPGVADKPGSETTTTTSTTDTGGKKTDTTRTQVVKPVPAHDSTQKVTMKDKNGKTWIVAPENVEAFKKANGIK